MAYIYGERYLEQAIEDICTKMVAIELLMSDDRASSTRGNRTWTSLPKFNCTGRT